MAQMAMGDAKRSNRKKGKVPSSLRSMKVRLTLIFIFLVIVPIVLVGTVSSLFYRQSMTKKVNEIVENNTLQTSQVIGERIDTYRYLLEEIVTNTDIIGAARKMDTANDGLASAYAQQILVRDFSDYVTTSGYCTSVVFVSGQGYAVYDRTMSPYETIWTQQKYRDLFSGLCSKEKQITYLSGTDPRLRGQSMTDGLVYLGYPLYDWVTGKFEGIILISLEKSIFRYSAALQANQKQLTMWAGINSVVVDQNANVVSTIDGKNSTDKKLEGYIKETSQNSAVFMTRGLEGTPWKLVSVIDRSVLFREANRAEGWMLALMVIVCLMFLALLLYTENRLERSVVKIAAGIRNYVPGSASIPVDLQHSNELYVIVRQFNEMAKRNNLLISELETKNTEIAHRTNQQKKAELKALEAQINPHFLYNVLDSINWMAVDKGEMTISRMLSSLGSILRYSVTNIDIVVLLRAEIEWMKKYVYLQQERYGNTFICEYDVAEDTLDMPIKKMLLQPLVENAIQHGFEGVHAGGVLELRTRRTEEGRLEIRIRDNGCGMDEKTLREIRSCIDGKGAEAGAAIGISNVVSRLHAYYREDAGFTVQSRLGEGTEITMLLPDLRDGKEERP